MPIELICSRCGRQLRVADQALGKRARCPECKNVFDVGPAPVPPAIEPFQTGSWLVRIEDGRQFGPVPKSELDQWVAEGRITAKSKLIQEGGEDWLDATKVYPGLAPPQPAPNPFADASAPANPYSPPGSFGPNALLQPNRGGLVLTLGILSIFFTSCTCFVLGIVAWVMGQNDLRSMRSGAMDPSGYGTTQAGMILGGIATVLHGLWFLFVLAANG